MSTTTQRPLHERLRQHSRDLLHANSFNKAVDWAAKADLLMQEAAAALEQQQKQKTLRQRMLGTGIYDSNVID
jgi:hypothetical protein